MSEPQGSPCPGEPERETLRPQPMESTGRQEIIVVHDEQFPVFDTGHFQHMQRVAKWLAGMSIVPESLRKGENGALPQEVVIANCLMIVNQARRWRFDPYALLCASSFIHGKPCFEGKVIHAAIQQCLGIRLKYAFKDGESQDKGVTVSGQFNNETEPRTIFGQVKDWHRGDKSPWSSPGNWERQLRYRGAREWCRAYAPEVLMGVYGDDEMDPEELPRELVVRVIDGPPPPPPPEEGINQEPAQPTESESSQDPPPVATKPKPVKGEKPPPTMTLKRRSGK